MPNMDNNNNKDPELVKLNTQDQLEIEALKKKYLKESHMQSQISQAEHDVKNESRDNVPLDAPKNSPEQSIFNKNEQENISKNTKMRSLKSKELSGKKKEISKREILEETQDYKNNLHSGCRELFELIEDHWKECPKFAERLTKAGFL
jgi:hypothetical protein